MNGDGNGWAAGPEGTAMWGVHGAAGLMLVADGGETPDQWHVLMQHRAVWTNNGDTWALPGGARDSHETTAQAALREAVEETSIDPDAVEIVGEIVTAGPFGTDPDRPELAGGWTYTTVLARTRDGLTLETSPNNESLELRWVKVESVDKLPLMPAFGRAWPDLKGRLMKDWNA